VAILKFGSIDISSRGVEFEKAFSESTLIEVMSFLFRRRRHYPDNYGSCIRPLIKSVLGVLLDSLCRYNVEAPSARPSMSTLFWRVRIKNSSCLLFLEASLDAPGTSVTTDLLSTNDQSIQDF
jgi:hypothetical protein